MTSDAADREFREFAGGFADPLARLAYVLVARGDDGADAARADAHAVRALARTGRRWRDVQTAGTPEAVAVEALLALLPRRAVVGRPPEDVGPDVGPARAAGEPEEDGEAREAAVAREVMWRGWCSIPPRERVPFVFADAAVLTPQLRDLDVPDGFASGRRLAGWEGRTRDRLADAWQRLVGERIRSRHDLHDFVRDVLRARAAALPVPPDVYSRVTVEERRLRTRALATGGGVAAACVAVVVVAAVAAAPGRNQSPSAVPKPTTTVSGPTGGRLSPPAAGPTPTATLAAGQAIDWPLRGGSATDDRVLMFNLRTAFLAGHPDLIGPMQVLLASDQPGFRIAYVTGRTPQDVVGTWYYGQVGATQLAEGSTTSTRDDGAAVPVTAIVSSPDGTEWLIAVGPPGATSLTLDGAGAGSSLVSLHYGVEDGVVIEPVSGLYGPSVLVTFDIGVATVWQASGRVARFSLAGMPADQSPDAGSAMQVIVPAVDNRSPAATIVQRGSPPARLLSAALGDVHAWEQSGQLGSAVLPAVLWAGPDGDGDTVLALRAKTLTREDLVVIAWSGASSGINEYVMASNAPDYPFAFLYDSRGPRIGALGTTGMTSASLLVDDEPLAGTDLDVDGFGTVPVPGTFAAAGQRDFVIAFGDSGGLIVGSVPVPPTP